MLVTRVVLGAGVVNVRGLKTLRTSGLCGWALSILHMASTQETRFKQDQESTLDNLQLIKFTLLHHKFSIQTQTSRQISNSNTIYKSNLTVTYFFPFHLVNIFSV